MTDPAHVDVQQPAVETRHVPAAALRFRADPAQFAPPAEDSDVYPVEILARTGRPVEHWLWGRVVHDLAGMRHKPRVPIDWAHDGDEMLGYADKFSTADGNLRITGALVPYGDGDRAHAIAHKGRNGCPYQASIDFRGEGIRAEELGQGARATVNGYEIEGPALIFREWPLRAVALCESGVDEGTEATFSPDDQQIIPITIERHTMSQTQQTTTPDPAADEKRGVLRSIARLFGVEQSAPPPAAGADPPADTAARGEGQGAAPAQPQGASDGSDTPAAALSGTAAPAGDPSGRPLDAQRFIDAFGDKGARWCLEGKTFEEAALLALEETRQERDRLAERLSQARVELGDTEPAEFRDAEETPQERRAKRFTGKLGGRLGTYAASLELPNRRGNGSGR